MEKPDISFNGFVTSLQPKVSHHLRKLVEVKSGAEDVDTFLRNQNVYGQKEYKVVDPRFLLIVIRTNLITWSLRIPDLIMDLCIQLFNTGAHYSKGVTWDDINDCFNSLVFLLKSIESHSKGAFATAREIEDEWINFEKKGPGPNSTQYEIETLLPSKKFEIRVNSKEIDDIYKRLLALLGNEFTVDGDKISFMDKEDFELVQDMYPFYYEVVPSTSGYVYALFELDRQTKTKLKEVLDLFKRSYIEKEDYTIMYSDNELMAMPVDGNLLELTKINEDTLKISSSEDEIGYIADLLEDFEISYRSPKFIILDGNKEEISKILDNDGKRETKRVEKTEHDNPPKNNLPSENTLSLSLPQKKLSSEKSSPYLRNNPTNIASPRDPIRLGVYKYKSENKKDFNVFIRSIRTREKYQKIITIPDEFEVIANEKGAELFRNDPFLEPKKNCYSFDNFIHNEYVSQYREEIEKKYDCKIKIYTFRGRTSRFEILTDDDGSALDVVNKISKDLKEFHIDRTSKSFIANHVSMSEINVVLKNMAASFKIISSVNIAKDTTNDKNLFITFFLMGKKDDVDRAKDYIADLPVTLFDKNDRGEKSSNKTSTFTLTNFLVEFLESEGKPLPPGISHKGLSFSGPSDLIRKFRNDIKDIHSLVLKDVTIDDENFKNIREVVGKHHPDVILSSHEIPRNGSFDTKEFPVIVSRNLEELNTVKEKIKECLTVPKSHGIFEQQEYIGHEYVPYLEGYYYYPDEGERNLF